MEPCALLARAGVRVAIRTPAALRKHIERLPITQLALAPGITRDLHTTGVRTIGLLLELPRAALAPRFGPTFGTFLDRLSGAAPDPRPLFQLPAEYDAHFEFDHEVRSTPALLFIARRLLHEFAGFLRARDTAVQQFTLTLAHREQPATCVCVGLSVAERNADAFFAVVREHLERLELPAPTIGLQLSARRVAAPAALQPDLLNHAPEQSEPLTHTLDRITARLGAGPVHGLKALADHRPEASWAPAPLEARREPLHFPARPLWLLPQPRPLQRPPAPQITGGPGRIEAGWWDTQYLQRDYYIVRTPEGAELWVYHDLKDSGWYLHGFWS